MNRFSALIVTLLAGASFSFIAEAKIVAGAKAPDFAATSFTQTESTQKFDSKSLSGKVVYVDFWASWCAPCRQSFPVLDKFAKTYADKGFAMVGVNKDAQIKDGQRFLARTPASFTLVHDGDNAIAKAFDFKTMPTGFLIDRKGVVRFVHEGFDSKSEAALQAKIEALLNEK